MKISRFSTYFLPGRIFLTTLLIIIGFSSGCSRAPEDPAWFQSTETGETLDREELTSRIGEVDDLITIFRMREEYRRRGGDSQAINKVLQKRWNKLLQENPSLGILCPEADLVAFDYRKINPKSYRADYLFRCKQPFETDVRLALYGAVSPENRDKLSPSRREAGKESEVWNLNPVPPVTEWKAGDYYFLSQKITAADIPYNMSLIFYDPSRQPGQYGQKVQLGWRSGITEEALLGRIDRAENLIELYRLKGDCANFPDARKAFARKSDELMEETEALGKICEEAELVEFEYSRIGDKKYRVDYLFRVLTPLETDCLITLYGVVDENHRHQLSPARRDQGKKSEAWSFRPNPPTRLWPAGESVLISDEIPAQPIPYKMHTILYDRERRRQHGDQVQLGWRVDLGESESE